MYVRSKEGRFHLATSIKGSVTVCGLPLVDALAAADALVAFMDVEVLPPIPCFDRD